MKRVDNLYKDICDLDNIIDMTDIVLSKVKNKKRREKFILYKSEHIINIKNKLDSMNYIPSNYNIFLISDPKVRVIMSQNIEDKIISHLVSKYILNKVFDKTYIDSMCATRIGRGSSYAIKLMKKYINNMKLKYNNFYILKLDIKKYFYNVDHDILKKILESKIKDKNSLNIIYKIIDNTNKKYINERINNLKINRIKYLNNKKLIEETNNIPLYKYNKGCSIGDQVSQSIGLIYLNNICHYIKEELHISYLVNYMDDIICIHKSKEYLKYCKEKIENILNNEYKLELNNKTKIYSIKEGVEFLGYRFIIKNNKLIMKLRNNTKKNFKKKVKLLKTLKENKYISINKYNNIINSYKGHLYRGNCNNLLYRNGVVC